MSSGRLRNTKYVPNANSLKGRIKKKSLVTGKDGVMQMRRRNDQDSAEGMQEMKEEGGGGARKFERTDRNHEVDRR